MAGQQAESERSYGCTFACGNPYDFIFVSVRDGTTEFLCLPCMVQLAADMVKAVTDPHHLDVIQAVNGAGTIDQSPMSGNGAKGGRKNAPATNLDPELFDSFDSVITEDELPEAFK